MAIIFKSIDITCLFSFLGWINPYQFRMTSIDQQLKLLQWNFKALKLALTEKLTNPASNVNLNHLELKEQVFDLSNLKLTIKEKVVLNRYVRTNIRSFIEDYVKVKLQTASKSKDPRNFVFVLNDIWSNYQRFVFAHEYVCDKFKQFFQTFPKMNNAREFAYTVGNSQNSEEVVHISIIAVNQLRKFFEGERIFGQFTDVFSQFLLQEREGKAVPREQIRETVHSLESCYFDFEATCGLDENGKAKISKRLGSNDLIPIIRRATDHDFFSKCLLDQTLLNCANFYKDFVMNRAMQMNTGEQVTKMLSIIEEEEKRAIYYIHTPENRHKYIQCLNANLIQFKMSERMRKQDGLRAFLQNYDQTKDDYQREIKQFWKIYSRILDKALPVIKEIYSEYMLSEAEKVSQKSKKPPEFIQEMIRINSKSIRIVQYFNGNFQIENERNIKVRGMLSNDITKKGREEAKFDAGARNLAWFINQKFKVAYTKGGLESLGETYKHIVHLFKILQEKTRFIDEEEKMMSGRLLEDIDFSNDLNTGHIINMEKHFIEEIQKECGVNEVKELAENIKDIERSIEINSKLKEKIGADKILPLNQIIIKTAAYWAEKTTYALVSPPISLLKSSQTIEDYFKKINSNIQFQFNNGVSSFRGDFEKGKKQNFQFKNIYLLILLFIDESDKKTILFGNLKKKIEAVGVGKQRGQIELAKNVIELLYSGLLRSGTKELRTGDANLCKIVESDEFTINSGYDFVEEEKKKKGKVPPKPIPYVKTVNLQLSEELKRGFQDQIRAYNEDERKIQAERKFKVEAITVKTLKHAHHHQMDCTFEQLFKETQSGRYKEFRVNEKYLKEIVEELINKKYCERVEGQRNVFRYIA